MNSKSDTMPKPADQEHQQHPSNEEFKKHVQDPNDPEYRQNYQRRWTDKLENKPEKQPTR